MKLGEKFPNFDLETSKGKFKFHDFIKNGPAFTVLFSHPADFTPVCTTELNEINEQIEVFKSLGVQLIGLSCDTLDQHFAWEFDICSLSKKKTVDFPIIADELREIVTELGMLDPLERDSHGLPLPARALYVIDRESLTLRLSIVYPATTGRDYNELIRVIKSLNLTKDFKLATPVNWKEGERVIVAPAVKTEDAEKLFLNFDIRSVPSGKQYLRYCDAPKE